MITLEQFQREILQPLRNKREADFQEVNAAYRKLMENDTAYRAGLEAEESTFFAEQAEIKAKFEAEHQKRNRQFRANMMYRRVAMAGELHREQSELKEQKRKIFDGYNDAVGTAFANFNAERKKAGELPVTYDEVKKIIIDGGDEL